MNQLTAEAETGYIEVTVRAKGQFGPLPEWVNVRHIAQAAIDEYHRQHREHETNPNLELHEIHP